MTASRISKQPRAIVTFVGIVVVMLGFGAMVHGYYRHLVRSPLDPADSARHEFTVEQGSSASTIGRSLVQADLIRSKMFFTFYVKNEGLEGSFIPGRYALRRDQSMEEIITTLTNPAGAEVWITTLEGWRAEEVAAYLAAEDHLSSEAFMTCVKTCTFDYDFLSSRPEGASLEGYLFPDTYIIPQNAEPRDVIARMLENLDQKLTLEMRADIEKQGRTIHEIMTMASIIEREVRGSDEQKIVSGILWKRHEAGMGLGADATVLYALGDWKATLTTTTLGIDSPYNTRKYAGLPPGPISNPGLSSIMAAIYPEDSPYWYYLTTPDTGEAKYGKTLDEHNENVARYLR